jgi:tetratricopeptide (TPR) repeat protein
VSLVILEDLMKNPTCAAEAYLLYAKALLSTGQLDGAETAYRKAISLKPALKNQTLEEALNLPPKSSELWNDPDVDSEGRIRMPGDAEEDFMFTAMEKPDTTFADVGGWTRSR